MSIFSQRRVLSQVAILSDMKVANVQWSNQVLKDGVVISEQFERKAYAIEQKDEFLDEVENAQAYISALGWV